MVRGCDTRDRRAYSRVGGDLERATGGRRGEGRRSLRRRRNGDEHSHGSEDPLGSTSWEHGRGSATCVGQLSSRGTGKGESSLSLSNLSLVLPFSSMRASHSTRVRVEERAIPTIEQIFPSFLPLSIFEATFQISLSRKIIEEIPIRFVHLRIVISLRDGLVLRSLFLSSLFTLIGNYDILIITT